jgi:hypothetical protein
LVIALLVIAAVVIGIVLFRAAALERFRQSARNKYGLTDAESKVWSKALSGVYGIYTAEGSVKARIDAAGGRRSYRDKTRQAVADAIIAERDSGENLDYQTIAYKVAGESVDHLL